MPQLILASASPRRRQLLEAVASPFTVIPSAVEQPIAPGTPPQQAVTGQARCKAQDVFLHHPQSWVIGADTVVAINGQIFGKPHSRAEAQAMLRTLSGRTHAVYTGVALLFPGGEREFFCQTDVTFYPLSDPQIEWYLDTGEPFDKAGAYGIQGYGQLLIRGICGDYFNVMGLPTAELARALSGCGFPLPNGFR